MRQIRSKVFETNSSSSHSLTVVAAEVLDFSTYISKEQAQSGVLVIEYGEFGWEKEYHYDFTTKLSYLLTDIKCLTRADDITQTQQFQEVNALIKEKLGVSLEVEGDGYIDHQSVGTAVSILPDKEKLSNFLFGPNSYVETGNDNEYDDYDYDE